jgi:hypothetical protein
MGKPKNSRVTPGQEKALDEEAHKFALLQVGELIPEMDEKEYWDSYHAAYQLYLAGKKSLDEFGKRNPPDIRKI